MILDTLVPPVSKFTCARHYDNNVVSFVSTWIHNTMYNVHYTICKVASELRKTKAVPTKSEGLNRVPLSILYCVNVLRRSGPIEKALREIDNKA